jgi:hypothetical protein
MVRNSAAIWGFVYLLLQLTATIGEADRGSTQSGRNAFSNGTYCHSAQTCSRGKPRVVAEALHKRSNNPSGGAGVGEQT